MKGLFVRAQSGGHWRHLWRERLEFVDVRHVEEKKSDVNLATRLVADAGQEDFGTGGHPSNDSDFDAGIEVRPG